MSWSSPASQFATMLGGEGGGGGEAMIQQHWYWMVLSLAAALAWSMVVARFYRDDDHHHHPNDPKKKSSRGSLDLRLPDFILNVRFALNAPALFQTGYQKFKNVAYTITRSSERITILPGSLVEELANLPAAVASPQLALDHDLLGSYTGVNLIVDSHLHYRIVQRKITPRIPLLLGRMEDAVAKALPKALLLDKEGGSEKGDSEWKEKKLFEVLAPVAARVAADILVGREFADHEDWLHVSVHYTEDVFTTAALLRVLPTSLRKIVFALFPSYWRIRKNVSRGTNLLSPKIRELIAKNDAGEWEPQDDNPDDANMLSWLCHSAKGSERDPAVIAQALMLISLASVHTTLARIVNVLYDVTASGPELGAELVSEIASSSSSAAESGSSRSCYYDNLRKLDSVMHESQRLSPPVATGLKRVFQKPYTFSDGTTHIKAGEYVCVPVQAIENDPDNLVVAGQEEEEEAAQPEKFDGLRNFRARQQQQQQQQQQSEKGGGKGGGKGKDEEYLFTTPTRTSLNFGYGKTACPGRFFAGYAIKVVLAQVLKGYELKFVAPGDHDARPENLTFHEFLFTSPGQKMMVRRRKEEE